MSDRRALLTEREKEILSGEANVRQQYQYETASRIRKRIERLEEDTEFLAENREDLLKELQERICE